MLDKNDYPVSVCLDAFTGILDPSLGIEKRHVSDMRMMFDDQKAVANILASGDRLVYEIHNYAFITSKSDMAVAVTRIFPGKVGNEYYMSKGHQHERDDQAEIYYCVQGRGYLLLDTMEGEFKAEPWEPGVITHIPPMWAHRAVNTGDDLLVYVGIYHIKAGHLYSKVEKQGFTKIIVEQNGRPVLLPKPSK